MKPENFLFVPMGQHHQNAGVEKTFSRFFRLILLEREL
jgi:hypothetical protein